LDVYDKPLGRAMKELAEKHDGQNRLLSREYETGRIEFNPSVGTFDGIRFFEKV
jgi:hypothetical protein